MRPALSGLVFLLGLLAQVSAEDPECDPTDPLTPELICAQRAAFGGSSIVPEIIPSLLPTGVLHLLYGDLDVGAAQQLSPSRVVSTPDLTFEATPNTESGPTYTLVLLDGDVLHWMQTDLSIGEDSRLTTSTRPAARYGGPNPSRRTGEHRYVALLFSEPTNFILPAAYQSLPSVIIAERLHFNLDAFIEAAHLGSPVGGNFFTSTFDNTGGMASNTVEAATGAIPGATAAVTSVPLGGELPFTSRVSLWVAFAFGGLGALGEMVINR